MRTLRYFFVLMAWSCLNIVASEKLLTKNRKILFLGDSITQAGGYVINFESWLVRKYPDSQYTVINAGVSSETISGLSENGHAGGRFPRPCVFERLERVLAKTNPDLIIACYGMNCGIYQPLDKIRTEKFKNGILRLRAAAKQYNSEVVHVTSPIFDSHGKSGFDYDSVLTEYSKWLITQRSKGWNVVDLHSEMRKKVNAGKLKNSKFTVQRDRVHPNGDGHWMMTQSLISFFGDSESAALKSSAELLSKEKTKAVSTRSRTYQKAIHAETNPLRPGVPKGGDLKKAEGKAKELGPIIYGE